VETLGTSEAESTPAEPGLTEAAPTPQAPSFILQVRSYPDPDSADARRAEIILNGLSADVVKTVEGGQTWYRVISGPYDSQEAAVIAQQTLQHSGIDSIVVKR
jgi:cell division protein FtsN